MSDPIPVTEQNAEDVGRILQAFLRPFAPEEIKMKPQKITGNRALVISYIDARLVLDRLDEVVGLAGWKDEYIVLPTGEVECRLSVRIAGEWITKSDVGSQSEQPDEGDRMKAAYSDALKRAAVKFGIGRFLYRLAQTWMDYDPVKKCIVRAGAKPTQKPTPAEQPKPQPSASAQEIAAALASARARADGVPLWNRYDAALKDGKVDAVDKAFLDDAFRQFGARFPAAAQAAKA